MADAADQAGRAFRRVGLDGDERYPHLPYPGLDQGLEGVGVVAQHHGFQRHFPGDCSEAAGGIRDLKPGSSRDHPAADGLQGSLMRRKMRQGTHAPVADHHLRLTRQNRLDKFLNILGAVLVIGVGVDNHIRAQPQAGIQAVGESLGQAQVPAEVHNMVSTGLTCGFGGVIRAAIIHHQDLYAVKTCHRFRKLRQGLGEDLRFVVAWNLNDQFHWLLGSN